MPIGMEKQYIFFAWIDFIKLIEESDLVIFPVLFSNKDISFIFFMKRIKEKDFLFRPYLCLCLRTLGFLLDYELFFVFFL
jgi:hypothetical protein